MSFYAGLDVSDKSTHICVIDDAGAQVWRGVCASEPQVLADRLKKHCPGVARVVLETGALSANTVADTTRWRDVIKRATSYLGIQPCAGCQRRAALLNRWTTFGNRASK